MRYFNSANEYNYYYFLSFQMVLNNVGLTDSMSQPQCNFRCSVTSWICWSMTMVSVPCM